MAITGVTDYTNIYAAGRANESSTTNNAQNYLKELKEKYPGVDITVADFNSEKQSDAYMLGTRGYNNIAVSSSIIERMASDPAAAAKYERVFAQMSGNAERVEKFARENNDEILGARSLEKMMEKMKAKQMETETSQAVKVQEDGKGIQMDLSI